MVSSYRSAPYYSLSIYTESVSSYDFGLPTLAASPGYYKSAGFHCPTDYKDTPFQKAFSTDLGFYEYIAQQPDASKNFHIYMSALQKRSLQWLDWFPVQERLIDSLYSYTKGSVFLVDIGGGEGHYIRNFHKKFPQATGRLVLQDMHKPDERLEEGIEYMEHSFFDPQPFKGNINGFRTLSVTRTYSKSTGTF